MTYHPVIFEGRLGSALNKAHSSITEYASLLPMHQHVSVTEEIFDRFNASKYCLKGPVEIHNGLDVCVEHGECSKARPLYTCGT